MKFLIDNQLPIALSRFIEAQGINACHMMDVHLDEASDKEIWLYAKTNGYTLISKDEDFLHFAALDSECPAIVWVRLGNCRKVMLLEAFAKILPQLLETLENSQQIVEIR